MRKPLYPAERKAPPASVCVTGGTGYIGCCVVARLLAAGHTVHATWRACETTRPGPRATHDALFKLPGAASRLRWFVADLLDEGSYDEAIAGCKFVIHTAGPVVTHVSKAKAYATVLKPALEGTRNVLRSVERAPSVEKVVMTSSLAAVMGAASKGPDHVYTEDDHNQEFWKDGWPYFTAKTSAEWEAYAMCGLQRRWRLVTICPGYVLGPPAVPSYESESVKTLIGLVDGSASSVYPTSLPPTVDVDDVAAAHVLAISVPGAKGRYLLAERGVDLPGIASMLRKQYGGRGYAIPDTVMPQRRFFLMLRLLGAGSLIGQAQAEFHKRRVDCSKARSGLGLASFIPLEQTLTDTMEQLIREGAVKPASQGTSGGWSWGQAGAVAVAAAAAGAALWWWNGTGVL